ncbi:hypothetical protein LTR56_020449 [Elasticomyces elasticus]|nr:hypothetical protein LTR56_020449 [Elasticomyces elasticus]KAK3645819.1 hypothetical protein LTR22_014587 [Elasticomyces elasticus]KAK4910570.1 hypothetical protein LTR49_020774 [Elasticomyces elasticus]KAK5747299.1 hypothetical protein LTS12_022449 [Elasticomyces elasticus]
MRQELAQLVNPFRTDIEPDFLAEANELLDHFYKCREELQKMRDADPIKALVHDLVKLNPSQRPTAAEALEKDAVKDMLAAKTAGQEPGLSIVLVALQYDLFMSPLISQALEEKASPLWSKTS